MKRLQLLVLSAVLLPSFVFADGGIDLKTTMVGKWQCTFNEDQPAMSMVVVSKDEFNKNGTLKSLGETTLNVKAVAGGPVTYSTESTATWQVKGNVLVTTITSSKLKSVSHDHLNNMIPASTFVPKVGEKTEAQLVKGSAKQLQFSYLGKSFYCNRR